MLGAPQASHNPRDSAADGEDPLSGLQRLVGNNEAIHHFGDAHDMVSYADRPDLGAKLILASTYLMIVQERIKAHAGADW